MKYAILSTDNNPEYYSLLPLVCYSWRKIGYTPFVICVGLDATIREWLMVNCSAQTLPVEYGYDVRSSTMAQFLRLFAFRHFQPEDILLSADADMVMAKDIFNHDVSNGEIISYGFDLTGRSELPICYVKSMASKWRELIREDTTPPPKSYSDKWEDYWSVDQQLLTQRAHEYGMNRITFIDRGNQNKHGLPTGRWDRHDWAHIPDDIIDVHMKRNDWDAQIQVFQRLWPGEDYSFILKFKEALNELK